MLKSGKPYIHLQNVGNVPAHPARDLKVGDRVMWNYGAVEQVQHIERSKTGSTLIVTFLGYPDTPRRLRAETLVAICDPRRSREVIGDSDWPAPAYTSEPFALASDTTDWCALAVDELCAFPGIARRDSFYAFHFDSYVAWGNVIDGQPWYTTPDPMDFDNMTPAMRRLIAHCAQGGDRKWMSAHGIDLEIAALYARRAGLVDLRIDSDGAMHARLTDAGMRVIDYRPACRVNLTTGELNKES